MTSAARPLAARWLLMRVRQACSSLSGQDWHTPPTQVWFVAQQTAPQAWALGQHWLLTHVSVVVQQTPLQARAFGQHALLMHV